MRALRRHRHALALVTASTVLVVGTFMPWVRSGERDISLYELRQVASRLEVDVDLRLLAPIVVVPLALAAALLLRWSGRPRAAWALALGAAGYTALGGLLLTTRSPLPTGTGIPVAVTGAALVLAAFVFEVAGGHIRSARAAADSHTGVATTATERRATR